MAIPVKGIFQPQNPEKYTGEYPIIYRSSWEHEFMTYCDNHPDVVEWASEPVKIPYKDPTRERTQSLYVPDFLVTIVTGQQQNRQIKKKLIEIKPMSEALTEHARTKKDAMVKMKNDAKWGAAQAWAMRRGIEFHVMTEGDMFHGHANRQPRKNPIRAAVPHQVKKITPKKAKKPAAKVFKALSRGKKAISSASVRKAAKAAKTRKVKKS